MSDDLISRSSTIESIWVLFNNTYNNARVFEPEETKLANRILSDVQKAIENAPVAYDVERVVDQTKEKDTLVCCSVKCNDNCGDCEHGCLMNGILKIVKAGGISETD